MHVNMALYKWQVVTVNQFISECNEAGLRNIVVGALGLFCALYCRLLLWRATLYSTDAPHCSLHLISTATRD